ncbi:MAG: M3 family metallopeptidase [Gammaproteobacteria bacterium]
MLKFTRIVLIVLATTIAATLFLASYQQLNKNYVQQNWQDSLLFIHNPEQYTRSCEKYTKQARQLYSDFSQLNASSVSLEEYLSDYDDLLIAIKNITDAAVLFVAIHPNATTKQIANLCARKAQRLINEIYADPIIYENLTRLSAPPDKPDLNYYRQEILKQRKSNQVNNEDPIKRKKIRSVDLHEEQQKRLFRQNIVDYSEKTITLGSEQAYPGLSKKFIRQHPEQDGKVEISTQSYATFMANANDDRARYKMYIAYNQRAYPENKNSLEDLLNDRYALARLFGYDSWADYALRFNMLNSTELVADFIDKMQDMNQPILDEEQQVLLQKLKQQDPEINQLAIWQFPYLSKLVKQDLAKKGNFNTIKAPNYFSYDNVKQGIFEITAQLFDIEYKKADVSVWDPSVEAYEIYDKNEELLGLFFLDMRPREGKHKGSMHRRVQRGIVGKQLPISALIGNFRKTDDQVDRMTHRQVVSFFHEFGHLMHFIFVGDEQSWYGFSNTFLQLDFIETPAKFFELLAKQPEILKQFAVNKEGEPIPNDLIEAIQATSNFNTGIQTANQLFRAAMSYQYHLKPLRASEMNRLNQKMFKEYLNLDLPANAYPQYAFGHLASYSARYYTYLWSGVIAQLLFDRFSEEGLLNRDSGMRFREMILAPGASKPALDLINNYLGENYTIEELLENIEEQGER